MSAWRVVRRAAGSALALVVALMVSCGGISEEDRASIVGHWVGDREVGGMPHVFVLHFEKGPHGSVAGNMEVPLQSARDLVIDDIECRDGKLRFQVPRIEATFDGTVDPSNGTIAGAIIQRGVPNSIVLHRADSLFVKSGDYVYRVPPALDDGWEVASLDEVGLDADVLTELVRHIFEGRRFKEVDSVIIVRAGKLVLEEYRRDFYGRDFEHNTASVTKSVTSALVGIALEEGFIDSLGSRLSSYFPDYTDGEPWSDAKASITLEHLLTMHSGLDCDNWDETSPGHPDKMWRSSDYTKFYLELPMAAAPGERFMYCEGDAMLIGEVLRRATGMTADALAANRILRPMGIEDYRFEYTPAGLPLTGTGLHMRSRDMAKFGQMYLDGGIWKGRRIVPEWWVELSTQKRVESRWLYNGYGYFWWCDRYEVNGEPVGAYLAVGNGGQVIEVLPALDMVVVFTCGRFDRSGGVEQTVAMTRQFVLKAVR